MDYTGIDQPDDEFAALDTEGMSAQAVALSLGLPVDETVSDAEYEVVEDEDAEDPEDRNAAQRALYGESFPLALDREPEKEDWVAWPRALWDRHAEGIARRVMLSQRNRLIRGGVQWIQPVGAGQYREPIRPRDSVRAVHNMVEPALDMRLQIVSEQRPGFRTKPITAEQDDQKKAESQQLALEYQYDQQQMERVFREAAYWAGTDGVSFLHQFWDPDRGPWHEFMDGDRSPLGDLCTRVQKIEEVRVSANATATERPTYWVIRTVIPLAEAVKRYGSKVVRERVASGASGSSYSTSNTADQRYGFMVPGEDELLENQETVEMYVTYCEPTEYLPDGLVSVIVGDEPIYVGDLPFGTVPMARFTDGSTDPAFYPKPIMEGWLDHQFRVNTLISKWIESIRVNSGGRFAMKPGTVSNETLIGGLISAIEVSGMGSISDSIMPIQGFSVGNDVMELLTFEIKNFEQKSGWNDAARGSISSNASGRAIMAIREQLERIFAPTVNAASVAMTDWAKITLFGMAWGYDLPRTVGVFGTGRPDLARQLQADDFDGVCDVEIDPETLMPMPRPLRLFLLDQMYDRQLMTAQEYRRRSPFAWTRNMASPDDDHEARARRVVEAIRSGAEPPPMRWQDNEAIHQDVLERELILNDAIDPQIWEAANQRWMQLADQAKQKAGGAPPGPGGPPAPSGDGPPNGESLPPGAQPFLGTNPGVAAASVPEMSGMGPQITKGLGADFTSQY